MAHRGELYDAIVPPPARRAPGRVPYPLLIATLFAVVVGAALSVRALLERHSYAAILERGTDSIAWITDSRAEASGGIWPAVSHSVDLVWRDGSGNERHFGPRHVSEEFWAEISAHDVVARRQIRIRYLEDDRTARPLIAGDVAEWRAQDTLETAFGTLFLFLGLGLSGFTIRRMRLA